MTREISNYDDVIDSRDVIARLEELQDEQSALVDEVEDAQQSTEIATDAEEEGEARERLEVAESALEAWEGDNLDELETLRELNQQGEDYASDWRHGEQLIRASYFEQYAAELAEDIGAIGRNARWPLDCIDWERAARELKMDYTEIDFDGVSYWVR